MSIREFDTVVIGGGPSGIAAALRRNKRLENVLIIEQTDHLGGKLDTYEWQGFKWDKGPSLFTLPDLVDDLFRLYGKNPTDYFQYVLHDENCRYHFKDGTHFTLYSSSEKRTAELSKHFKQDEIDSVEKYITKIGKTYDAIGELFIGSPKLSFADAFKPKILKQYPKIVSRQMLFSMNDYNERLLKNEKLVQLFNRYGTYNGSNPYKMSGLYSMIPHLELNIGTYFPKGGMRSIVESLITLAKEEGVHIKLSEKNTKVIPTEDGYTIQLENETIKAKNVICSIDHVNFYKKVLTDDALYAKHVQEERSTSAVVFYWAVEGKHENVGLHNIIFSSDYVKEFKQLFDDKVVQDEPTIYIHNSSAVEKSHAPETGENWFVMINAPAGVDVKEERLEELRQYMKKGIKNALGIDLENKILHEENWSMRKIEKETGSFMGSLYGGAFNTKTASFKRHGNESKKYKNLYFTGGSVHPGGGIPLVLKSAKIVDELMEKNAKS